MFLLPKNWILVRDTKVKGKGVFVKHEIIGGTVIGDYLGTVTHPDDIEDTDGDFYDLTWNEKASIVADPEIPGIHLVNHSCTPNCAMFPYRGHILYFALRRIFAGEELTISYALNPPEADELVLFDTCRCGTPVCRGTLYNSPQVNSRYYQFEEKMGGNYFHRLPGSYGSQLTLLDEYPEFVRDYPVYDLFGSWKHRTANFSDRTLPSVSTLRMLIRESGRQLSFPKMNFAVCGILNGLVVAATK